VHALPQPPGPYPMAMFAVYVAPGAMGPAFHAEFFQMFPLVSLILYERKVIARGLMELHIICHYEENDIPVHVLERE